MEKQCEHYDECGGQAEYELTLAGNGSTIHVCEDCDEDYACCNVCGDADQDENMSFLHSADEWKTCCHCIEKLLKEAKTEMAANLEAHIASFLPTCAMHVPEWFKQVVTDDAAAIWQEQNQPSAKHCITTAFEHALMEYFARAGNIEWS